jgi:hypothetical protein
MPAVSEPRRLNARGQCRVAELAIVRQLEVVEPSQGLANTPADSIFHLLGILHDA